MHDDPSMHDVPRPTEAEEMGYASGDSRGDAGRQPHDPIHMHDGKWWFWNETWSDAIGPYATLQEAHKALDQYVAWLNGDPLRREEPRRPDWTWVAEPDMAVHGVAKIELNVIRTDNGRARMVEITLINTKGVKLAIFHAPIEDDLRDAQDR